MGSPAPPHTQKRVARGSKGPGGLFHQALYSEIHLIAIP